jgi:alkylation response protein AidB-like acyl-CoA dehydrogenase
MSMAAPLESVSGAVLDLSFTDEQEQLRDLTRSFLADQSGEDVVRAMMASDAGFDERSWHSLADDLGLPGLLVPERFGGAGLTAVELGIVLEEMGRSLYCGPFFSTAVMAAIALLESDDEDAQSTHLPGIAAGTTRMALALDEPGTAGFRPESVATRAYTEGAATMLDGTKDAVVDGLHADSLLVVAREESGLGLFCVAADAPGLERSPIPPLDPTRKLARIRLSRTPATRVAADDAAIERSYQRIVAALASEQAGGAQHCLDMAVEYARERIQFGRPIGSFQAIKHLCADLLVDIEASKSAARHAAVCVDEAPAELAVAASLAKSFCSEAYARAAEANLQIHGGIGFTWEHACHLYLKRARSSELLLGDPLHHRERLADLVGL